MRKIWWVSGVIRFELGRRKMFELFLGVRLKVSNMEFLLIRSRLR